MQKPVIPGQEDDVVVTKIGTNKTCGPSNEETSQSIKPEKDCLSSKTESKVQSIDSAFEKSNEVSSIATVNDDSENGGKIDEVSKRIIPKNITKPKCSVEQRKQVTASLPVAIIPGVVMIPGSQRTPSLKATCRYVQSYIICGSNGGKLVSDVLNKWKWHHLSDKTSLFFTLKWSELKHSIDYHTHREGEQMVNHYPNSSLLTTKIGLLESLRQNKTILNSLRLQIDKFFPVTYRMDIPTERDEFYQCYKPSDLWICKPTGSNQGKGIFLVKSLQQIQERLQIDSQNCPQTRRPTARIVQRYISRPLLLDERKFDIRVYLLFVSGINQLLAFYHNGYIRLSCVSYDGASSDMAVHLTNQYVQKKHPSYQTVKEDTVWDFDKFQRYLSEHDGLPCDWINKTLKYQMKRIMLGLHHCVRHKLEQRVGYFELFGLDFMLDQDYNLWLIEVNVNPALHTNCTVLEQLLPGLVEETLGIAHEVCSKSRRFRSIFPLEAQNHYENVFPLL